MNAISQIVDLMPKPVPVKLVADYFRTLALSGKGCASNNHSIARTLGLSTVTVSRAKAELVSAGRLVGDWLTWVSIDGLRFGQGTLDSDAEAVKTILRRRYGEVVDRRTVTDPKQAAHGLPQELLVDGRVMTWTQAVALAKRLMAEKR